MPLVYGSATKILRELAGSIDWDNDDGFEAETTNFDDNRVLCNSIEWNDEIVEDETDNKPIERAEDVVARRLQDDNMQSICTICFDDEEKLTRLACGHQFCGDCLETYISIQCGDASRCAYNVCVVTPVSSIELAIEYQWKACMQCPAFGCSALMSKTLIEHLTSATIFETFVRMSTNHIELMEEVTRRRLRGLGTDTDLTDEELKMVGRLPRDPEGYIQCPRCAEFAVTPARFGRLRCRACLLPLCRDCESEHDRNVRCDGTPRYGSLAMALSSKKSHAKYVHYLRTHSDTVRSCPNCLVVIEKNGGCPNMYCVACKKPFVWTSAKLQLNKSHKTWARRAAKRNK